MVVDIPSAWSGNYAIKAVERSQLYDLAQWQVTAKTNDLPSDLKPIKPLPPNNLPDKQFSVKHELTLDMSGGAMGNLQAAFYNSEKLSADELIAAKQVWTFNGVANLPKQPLIQVKVGEGVLIHMENNTRWPHTMHLHGHHFIAQNLLLQDELWQDTILMAPNQKSALRFRAERPGKWLLHCHMIEHQVAGMVTWIEVIA